MDYSILRLQDILSITLIPMLCFLTVAAHYYYKNAFSYWEKRGIKGPKPLPVFGNFLTLMFANQMTSQVDWTKKYGKIYGIYQGTKPQLVIADPEVMLQVCIKDFDAFQDRNLFQYFNKYQASFVFLMRGDHWKRVRTLLTPTFTSGKIKRMFKMLNECANDLVTSFETKISKDNSAIVNVKDLYGLYAMDSIATCCYGLKLERSGGKSNKTVASMDNFVELASKLFQMNYPRLLAAITLPSSILRRLNFQIAPESQMESISTVVGQLIEKRRKTAKKFDDYLQLLVDARLQDELDMNETDHAENHHAGLTQESQIDGQRKMVDEVKRVAKSSKVELSDLEVMSSAIFLLAVGLETTSSLLTHCTYALAFHPEIQERLYSELLKIVEVNGDKSKLKFEYDSLTGCHYLDSVLSETLRMLSSVLQVDRLSNRDCRIEKYNLDLPKDSVLFISLHSLMNDPDWWSEPNSFNPDRFLPGNKEKIVPGSYCPFGVGPRHCIGMRFSLT